MLDNSRRLALGIEERRCHTSGAREGIEILTELERNHLKALEKRVDHLARRIAESRRDLSYDRKELAALRWAIGMLGGAVPPGMVLVKRGGWNEPAMTS